MFHELLNRWQHWNERRRAIRQLRAMPDHLLADIGIERYEIEAVVNGLHASQPQTRRPQPQIPVHDMALTRG